MKKKLSASERRDLEEFHSVLRRAAERAERNRDTELAIKLAEELAVIDFEMRAG